MKIIIKEVELGKMLLSVDNQFYDKNAILNASYKYTDKCYINIERLEFSTEIYFESKEEQLDLKNIALDFGNELIDQQIRLNCGKEFKIIRDELVKKAFASISK